MSVEARKVTKFVRIDPKLAKAMQAARGVDWNAVLAEAVRFRLKQMGLKPRGT